MGCHFANLRIGLVVASVVARLLTPGLAPAQEKQVSGTKSPTVTTNLSGIGNKTDALKQMEEDLFRPWKNSSEGSLQGVAAPPIRRPPPSPAQSKRAKELMERRKNWPFMDPDKLLSEPTPEEMLNVPEYGPNGQEKKKLRPLEQFYQDLDRRGKAGRNKSELKEKGVLNPAKRSDRSDRPEETDSDQEPGLPGPFSESERALRKLFTSGSNTNASPGSASRNVLSDIFGVGSNDPSQEEKLERKKRMEEFQQILDPNWRPPVSVLDSFNPLKNIAETRHDEPKPGPGLGSLPGPSAFERWDAQLKPANPLLGLDGPADASKKIFGFTSLSPVLPKTDPPRPLPPPTFSVPRRSF